MVRKEAVRESYTAMGAAYAEHRSADDGGLAIVESVLADLEEPERILDAGCGPGTPVLRRLTETAPAVGLDLSRGQLELAAENAPDAALVQGDLTALPLDARTVDLVVAYWSLIHVPLEQHQTVLEAFARVLRPGGIALVCEGADGEWRGTNPDWLDSGVEMAWEIAGASATRDQLREAGFAIEAEWSLSEPVNPDDGDGTDDATEVEEQGQEEGTAASDDREDAASDADWQFIAARLSAGG